MNSQSCKWIEIIAARTLSARWRPVGGQSKKANQCHQAIHWKLASSPSECNRSFVGRLADSWECRSRNPIDCIQHSLYDLPRESQCQASHTCKMAPKAFSRFADDEMKRFSPSMSVIR